MNAKPILLAVIALGLASTGRSVAVVNCASGGVSLTLAEGEQRTVDLPPDGILCYDSVTLGRWSQLRFRRNAVNTPVHLLSLGDVVIMAYSQIDVNGGSASGATGGLGGPGGFDGGTTYPNQPSGGDGFGPGAGRGGVWSRGLGNHAFLAGGGASDGTPYGNVLQWPLIGGSGAGADFSSGGGGGGGAVLIASNTLIRHDGTIYANGASPNGAGGGIRLVAPKVLGSGGLLVTGSGAGRGRARIDTLDPTESFITFTPTETRVIGANLTVFPPTTQLVEIITVADTTIDPSTNTPVTVIRDPDSATNLPVTVRVTGFTGTANVKVVLTPASGPRRIYPLAIPMGGNPTATGTVNVDFDTNMITRVDAWAETSP